jgi:excinuclease ABC subunit B
VGVRVRYLHSDIQALERVEILRDLRLGRFDVLVGINLLREGLDLPEVSLVAILDADKEGFLRSDRSLIQTVGRAARNLRGRAILYADKVTGSMQRMMEETDRRRTIQIEHNRVHGITPRTIIKSVQEIELTTRVADARERQLAKVAETKASYGAEGKSAEEMVVELETEMREAAARLDFERAALLRDQLLELRASMDGAKKTHGSRGSRAFRG